MNLFRLFVITCVAFTASCVWAASDFAPVVPDLNLPSEDALDAPEPQQQPTVLEEPTKSEQPAKAQEGSRRVATRQQFSAPRRKVNNDIIDMSAFQMDNDGEMVEKMNPVLPPIELPARPKEVTPAVPAPAVKPAPVATVAAQENTNAAATEEETVPAREVEENVEQPQTDLKVSFNPAVNRDPTLSPDDTLLLKHREEERLRAIEAEKQRKLDAERKRLEELERQRQLELERLRDPSREIRGKIRISGIVGDEVFIGDKVYGVGKTVLGARIISVQPDSVVFIYKGQKFTKKVQLQ